VFNGISGGLLQVAKDDYTSLQKFITGENSDCSKVLLETLISGHMLVASEADEVVLLKDLYEASRHDSSHFALTIVTSLGCNFDCPYCFEAKHPSIMDADVQKSVLEVVDDQISRIRSFTVTWYGGEPLVGKRPLMDLSDAFIERCDTRGVEYEASIVTNGYLLDHETCRQLRDHRVSGAQVTLDGPPMIHDKMRPLANGKGSFSRIIENLHHAIDYLGVTVRMNVDANNFASVEELLKILATEGFAGKLALYAGQIVAVNDGVSAPSSTYDSCCFSNRQFAHANLRFKELARQYGFSVAPLPGPSGAPCTAVRANELVVGSKGELYKCWESVGNVLEVIGHIRDYKNSNGRLQKWLKYDPFTDDECRSCIALPVCMGGCAHHAMDPVQYENRCSTFRHTCREEILDFVKATKNSSSGLMFTSDSRRKMDTR